MIMDRPEISVIVPVYNTETYLSQCISSIISQSFSDFELLLVDDGSTDGSMKICERYAVSDTRIRIARKANGGPGAARNHGLSISKGKWIAFIDSDDFVKEDYLADLYECTADGSDLAISYPEVHTGTEVLFSTGYKTYCVSDDSGFNRLFVDNDISRHGNPWGKLYKADIIRSCHIRFDEHIRWGEDVIFLFDYLLNCNRIHVLGKANYCYRNLVVGSLTKRVNPVESELKGYYEFCHSANRLVQAKRLSGKAVDAGIGRTKAGFIWRILNSLYHSDMSRQERIETMESLDMSVITYSGDRSGRAMLLKLLLKHRMFLIYDIVRIARRKTANI